MRLVIACAIVAYINGLYGDWLDDDPVAIVENPDVLCPRGLRGLFDNFWLLLAHDFWGMPLASEQSHLSYRPLTTLSFRLQHALVGFDARSFSRVNVALHALVCILFSRCCAAPVLPHESQRVFAGLLFALHAVHVEAVTNTVGRAELLSAALFFAAVLLYRRLLRPAPAPSFCRTLAVTCGVVGLSGAAMLCKEVRRSLPCSCAPCVVRTCVRCQSTCASWVCRWV